MCHGARVHVGRATTRWNPATAGHSDGRGASFRSAAPVRTQGRQGSAWPEEPHAESRSLPSTFQGHTGTPTGRRGGRVHRTQPRLPGLRADSALPATIRGGRAEEGV